MSDKGVQLSSTLLRSCWLGGKMIVLAIKSLLPDGRLARYIKKKLKST